MLNTTQGTCRNFPYVFKGDALDYISVILALVTLFNSSFVSLIGNFPIAYVFYSTRQLWKKRYILTINFIFLNFVTALLAIPAYFTFLLSFVSGNAWCTFGDVSFVLHRLCFCMTIVIVSLISYQRFLSALYPYRYQALLTFDRHVYIAIASWFYGIILAIPLTAELKTTSWSFLKKLCLVSKIILLVHIATTVFCYGRMGYIASCHRRKIAHNARHLGIERKTNITSLHLIGTLLASTLPWLGWQWAQSTRSIQVEYFTNTIFFTSCFLNLFLYMLRNEDIAAAFKKRFKRKVACQEPRIPRARNTLHPLRNSVYPYGHAWPERNKHVEQNVASYLIYMQNILQRL